MFRVILKKIHNVISHQRRVAVLSNQLAGIINSQGLKNFKVLDLGCGDMKMGRRILSEVSGVKEVKHLDIYKPSGVTDWTDFLLYDGNKIPFADKYFDVTILIDVLHHIEHGSLSESVLKEILRVSKCFILKEHWQDSFYANTLLRGMDFVGNYGNGVSIPEKYYTKEQFLELFKKVGFKVKEVHLDFKTYSFFLFRLLGMNRYHVIYVLED